MSEDGATAFVAADNYYLYALNASARGAVVWSYDTGAGTTGRPPAVSGGVVFVGSGDFSLHAVNATTGVRLWALALYPIFCPQPLGLPRHIGPFMGWFRFQVRSPMHIS